MGESSGLHSAGPQAPEKDLVLTLGLSAHYVDCPGAQEADGVFQERL